MEKNIEVILVWSDSPLFITKTCVPLLITNKENKEIQAASQ
jgi:hypothetical protein